ncbi:MAG: polysaccharide deacetylase family protein [Gammaproteobacteria bacterium]
MNILTFDLEEWFHLLDHPTTKSPKNWSKFESRIDINVERILDMLEMTNTSATFFCLGWLAEKYPYLIKNISNKGFHIACHSHTHQLAYHQTRKEFTEDLLNAKATIENIIGKKVDTYRIPGFSLIEDNLWALDILAENGFNIDCSIFPASRSHGGLPNFKNNGPTVIKLGNGKTIKELPLNTKNILGKKMVFSGGGYFRLIPYVVLKNLFKRSNYVMTYFHPRDFDAEQPVIKDLGLVRKFKSYYGLSSAQDKLEKLLKDFDFIDVRTAVDNINWSIKPEYTLAQLSNANEPSMKL